MPGPLLVTEAKKKHTVLTFLKLIDVVQLIIFMGEECKAWVS